MQKYKIEISDLAEQDLEFAADYIAFDLKILLRQSTQYKVSVNR